MNLEAKKFYEKLNSLTDESTAKEKRKRGKDFEVLLRMILDENGLSPKLSFRPKGEEIDGSFMLNDRIFLLEAKWHKDSLPASAIYAFKGKVDGKLIGTVGIFISMSGYSKDAVEALSLGKTLNVILFDKDDIETSFEDNNSFKKILLTKLRKAAENGLVYYPIKSTQINYNRESAKFESREIETSNISTKEKLVIVCEGPTDSFVVETLIKRIVGEQVFDDHEIVIIAAYGKNQVPKLGYNVMDSTNDRNKVLYIVDGDNSIESTQSIFIRHNINLDNVVIPNPGIEVWLGMKENEHYSAFYRANKLKRGDKATIVDFVYKIDLKKLRENEAYRKFETLIKERLENMRHR